MKLDLTRQTQLFLGFFEWEIAEPLVRFSAGARSAVDIGAAAGEYTLYFLTKTTVGRVLCFEPSLEQRRELDENLGLNKLKDDPRLAVSDGFVGTGGNGEAALDELADRLEPPSVVKIDVDGMEAQILRGARILMRRPGVRWIIETHSAELEAKCLSELASAGLETRVIPNAWWRVFLPELRPIPHNRWLVAAESLTRAGLR